MRPFVIKFGGTSLGTPARLRRAARRVSAHARGGRPVVVVVSAFGRTTDWILKWVEEVGSAGQTMEGMREVDRALATGEELAASLFATALHALGLPALSLRGGEAGILAEGGFGAGRIRTVDPTRLRELLASRIVPVVAGFQGARGDGETLTLGRGGSDITAVALAGALERAVCHIVTDVDAVYARDPRVDATAPPYPELTHQELVALAESGAQVVHPEAARLACALNVPLRVYSYRAPIGKPVTGTRIRTPAGAPPAAPAVQPT